MIYNIYYCYSRETCFGLPSNIPVANFYTTDPKNFEFLAIYESETDYLEYYNYFSGYSLRDDWDQELNRVIQEIIDSPVIWYCLIHGKCHISDRYMPPKDPCNVETDCICEQIATHQSGSIISNVGDLNRYFDDASDGYTTEKLEEDLALYQFQGLKF